MTSYNYTKSPADVGRLTLEITASAIVTALDHIDLLGNQLTIHFRADLSAQDETLLDTLVDEHTGEALPSQATLVEIDTPKDSDGSPLQRVKITTTGWHYQLHGVEFATSQLDSVYSKKVDGTNFGYSSIKCYDANDVLLTEQEDCDTDCVKTILDWEPTHDYEIVGGLFKQSSLPNSDVRLWVVGVPDVPEQYGGSKSFAVNVNLKYMGLEEGVKVDGRAPKYLTYSAINHTNKLRVILKHAAGVKHNVHIIFELFKA